ncbi:MAG: phosphoenolpyruvate--protein phosphotransferase [bacterium]
MAAAPGVGQGSVYILIQGMAIVACVRAVDQDAEVRRFEQALHETRLEIAKLRQEVVERLGESEAAIFDAHLLVLEDVALIDDVTKEVRKTGFNIEFCFQEVAQRYITIFENIEDDFLRERASDIRDVTGRVMDKLMGTKSAQAVVAVEKQVVVAKDLTPSETASMSTDTVLAFVTQEGGRTGHSAIMARALEIPAVVGVRGLLDAVQDGDTLLVDGEAGLVIVNPTSATIDSYRDKQVAIKSRRNRVMADVALPDETTDGTHYNLLANIGGPEDMEDAHTYVAHGVGLYRTENLFLRLDDWPTEEQQFDEYAEVVRQAKGRLVTFRTLDLGGDKKLGDLTDEANPFMGYRAIRLCLDRPDIFAAQLRAILRASVYGPVAVMFPMISGVEELRRAKEFYQTIAVQMASKGIVPKAPIRLGAMIEIPAAAVVIDDLVAEVDFVSVGTNDLVQYLLAVDRGNQRIASHYEPANPAVVRTLERIFSSAAKKGVTAAVCGELAGDPLWAPLLIGLGATELSMSSPSIPEVRFILRHSSAKELKLLAQAAVTLGDSVKIKNLLADFALSKVKHRS